MNNEKIGKLIKEQRKKKGLTQQELGDKLGIGFRSVSKWERGLTCPDITIINELSKILGISSDELLSGKINKENKEPNDKKISFKFKIIFSIIITLIVILITSCIYYNNQTYTYGLVSDSKEYYVDGNIIFDKSKIIININKLELQDKELYPMKMTNYEYQIVIKNKIVVAYGSSPQLILTEKEDTIETFINNFRISYNGETPLTKKEILTNNIIIKLEFITENNQILTKEIILKLSQIKSEKK